MLVLDADPASAEGTAALEGLLDRLGEGAGVGGDRAGRATAVIGFCLAAGAGTRLERR